MKTYFAALMILAASTLGGCAQMQQSWVQNNCNPTAAYADGVNQGMQPDMYMTANFAASCPSNQDAINAAYAKGFAAGLKGRTAQVQQQQNDGTLWK